MDPFIEKTVLFMYDFTCVLIACWLFSSFILLEMYDITGDQPGNMIWRLCTGCVCCMVAGIKVAAR